jgi:hypothetical protein
VLLNGKFAGICALTNIGVRIESPIKLFLCCNLAQQLSIDIGPTCSKQIWCILLAHLMNGSWVHSLQQVLVHSLLLQIDFQNEQSCVLFEIRYDLSTDDSKYYAEEINEIAFVLTTVGDPEYKISEICVKMFTWTGILQQVMMQTTWISAGVCARIQWLTRRRN